VTKQTLNAQLRYAMYESSGYEMEDSMPGVEEAQQRLDDLLESVPELDTTDPRDRELLELMRGV
jgi:DNA repair ATPase RecN